MTDDRTQAALRDFLRTRSTLTLATTSPEGQVMAASLFYVSDDDLSLYWVSGPHSRHSRNLRYHPQAAVTVHADTWTWADIKGVQMEGTVAVVPPGDAWQAVWARYLEKFPFAREFEAEVSRSNLYRFVPAWARLIDNAQGFGHKEEIAFF